jgi:hypothetical protein
MKSSTVTESAASQAHKPYFIDLSVMLWDNNYYVKVIYLNNLKNIL